MADPIVIRTVEPIEGKGDALKGCYYLPNGDDSEDLKARTYDFFDQKGTLKASDVKVGSEIHFHLDDAPDTEWSLTVTHIDKRRVLGDWGTVPLTGVGEPEGTYQGQAGGGFDVESAASAGSY